MATTIKKLKEHGENAAQRISESSKNWKQFLHESAALYKYGFTDIVLFREQRPDATLVASFDVWSKKLKRYIKTGSDGIGTLDKNGRLSYVFDISDTNKTSLSPQLNVWQFSEEKHGTLFDKASGNDNLAFGEKIYASCVNGVDEYLAQNKDFLRDFYRQTEMHNCPAGDILAMIAASASITVAARCGYPQEYMQKYLLISAFDIVEHRSFYKAFWQVGEAVNKTAQNCLRQIEKVVKLEKQIKQTEVQYNEQHGKTVDRREQLHAQRDTLQAGGGLLFPTVRGGRVEQYGLEPLWQSTHDLPAREQASLPFRAESDRQITATRDGFAGGSNGNVGADTNTDTAVTEGRRARQTDRPDGLDTAHDQNKKRSTKLRDERPNTHIDNKAADENQPPLLLEEKLIEIETAVVIGNGEEEILHIVSAFDDVFVMTHTEEPYNDYIFTMEDFLVAVQDNQQNENFVGFEETAILSDIDLSQIPLHSGNNFQAQKTELEQIHSPVSDQLKSKAKAVAQQISFFDLDLSGTADELQQSIEIGNIAEIEDALEKTVFENSGSTDVVNAAENLLQELSAVNFSIEDFKLGEGGEKAKYRMNIEAIQTLRNIEAEGRGLATKEEQNILSRYVGWGGISNAFNPDSAKWQSEYAQLESLLSAGEYTSARASTLNAHYTSPVVIQSIYEALENMGFKQGNVLEPAMGVGNFFGMLPESMANSSLYGVELDSISGHIAQLLYPGANIAVDGFEKVTFPDNYFDVAIGNVPFGAYQLSDTRYDKHKFSIHNYFFAKSLDVVRPNGVVAFITSKYLLDSKDTSVRKYIAERADLLGAIRLPNNAFQKNAGTQVTTDIVFLQKRYSKPLEMPDWVQLTETASGVPINKYYAENPNMVLGLMQFSKSMFGNEKDTACMPIEGADLSALLKEAVGNVEGEYIPAISSAMQTDANALVIPADMDVRNFSFTVKGEDVYFRSNSVMEQVLKNDTAISRIKAMVELRDTTRQIIDLQLAGGADEEIKAHQQNLTKQYDSFAKKHGRINDTGNRLAFHDDSSYPLLCSLETFDEEGIYAGKTDIFTKRTIQPMLVPNSVDTPVEALTLSMAERGNVDIDYMLEKLNSEHTAQEIIEALNGVIFHDPAVPYDGITGWQTADEYLSGNVREKLKLAQAATKVMPDTYALNVKRLQEVLPEWLNAGDITIQPGSIIVPEEYYTQFLHETFKLPLYSKAVAVYSKHTGVWSVTNYDGYYNSTITATYGTQRRSGYHLLDDVLNGKDSTVHDIVFEDGKEKRVVNQKETMLARQKQDNIKYAFEDWIFKDTHRREFLTSEYNEKYNAIRNREYDGSHLSFPGMNNEIALRPHQKNAIARTLYGGNTLLAHVVGAGKSYTMNAASMEKKRLGLCNKNMYVVPNHLTQQFASEFLMLYPNANLLVTRKSDFTPQNRKIFCSRIATGDWDGVIIGHSQFAKIPLSPQAQEYYLGEQMEEITSALTELRASDAPRYTIKQAEKIQKNIETKLERLNNLSTKDNVVSFEELGVDSLFVDEAHEFKNLFYKTSMTNVAGLNQTDAQKSSDLYMKCRYLDDLTSGNGVVFATGTPVSNTMAEMYTMMKYLSHQRLTETGFVHFDAWAKQYGKTVTQLELAPEGKGFRTRTRFAEFVNLPELMSYYKEFADVQTANMLNLPVPSLKTGEPIIVVSPPTPAIEDCIQSFVERAEIIRNGGVSSNEDNMLRVTYHGRLLGLDQRLVNNVLEKNYPEAENCKVNKCVQNIYSEYESSNSTLGAQLVFCDLSTPKLAPSITQSVDVSTYGVYWDIKVKLMNAGIPEHEIAFMHDAKTDTKKADLFKKVRTGKVRVLLGSTAKMGAGTNVQNRLVALHHIDVPWRPSDIEQREGRIIRQGNTNKEVSVYRYVTEGTFDAYSWSIIEAKQKFISQTMTSKTPLRTCQDLDETVLSFATVKALATGDIRIQEKFGLDTEVTRLSAVRAGWLNERYRLEDETTKELPTKIKECDNFIKGYIADIEHYAPLKEQEFSIVLNKISKPTTSSLLNAEKQTTYTEATDANKALHSMMADLNLTVGVKYPLHAGEFCGFKLQIDDNYGVKYLLASNQLVHRIELSEADGANNIQRLRNSIDSMPDRLENSENSKANLLSKLAIAKEELAQPFRQEQELKDKQARLTQLNSELDMSGKGEGGNIVLPETELAREGLGMCR